MLLIGQEIDGQWQSTPGQHSDKILVAKRTDQTVEGHGRDVIEHRTQRQTEATVRRSQRITGDLRPHLAIAQDEVGQDGEHRMTRRALETPDGHSTQAHAERMRVARQASATTTPRLVCQLKAKGQDKCDHKFDKGLAIAKQLKVGRFILKINRDSPVFAGPFGCYTHVSPPGHQVSSADETRWGEHVAISRPS